MPFGTLGPFNKEKAMVTSTRLEAFPITKIRQGFFIDLGEPVQVKVLHRRLKPGIALVKDKGGAYDTRNRTPCAAANSGDTGTNESGLAHYPIA